MAAEIKWTGSDFELDQFGISFDNGTTYQNANCVGSLEEEMGVKTVTKSCRGVVTKKRARGTGEGTLKLSMHMPWEIYKEAYGMDFDGLIEGVAAYGRNSVHKSFSCVAHVVDEDNNEKLKAYPNCIITTGVVRKIENGAEEVAEMELEIGVMPDEHGNGLYEAIVEQLPSSVTVQSWMSGFKPDMAYASEA